MEPKPRTSETESRLRYPEGWREIMEAPDALDYQTWMGDLTDLTQQRLREIGAQDAEDRAAVTARWQHAVESFAGVVIDPEEMAHMTQAQIIETALLTLQANVESIDWDELGLAFTVPNALTGEEVTIDLRHLPGPPPNN